MILAPAFVLLLAASTPVEAIDRTVFVTVSDGKGGAVTDLTAADLTVKEGGKDRQVTKVEPATSKMRLTVAVEERLIADTSVRMGVFQFLKRLPAAAQVRLQTIGLRNSTVVDYTSDLNALVAALNGLTLNPRPDSNVAESVLDIANEYAAQKPERPVLVLLAFSGGQVGVDPRHVLDKIRQSGMLMFTATFAGGAESAGGVGSLVDQSGREQVLGDGPKQSGGRRIEVTSTAAFTRALQQCADDLLAQYAVTYSLPDGVKADKRLSVGSKRKGLALRAPSAIPDR